MKIMLANGAELTPYKAIGVSKFVQGAQRDVLTFVFPAEVGMEALDAAFTPEACETITIVGEEGTENVYQAYTIRAELKKAAVEVSPATTDAAAVMEDRITVAVGQRTYTETQLAAMQASVTALEESNAAIEDALCELDME